MDRWAGDVRRRTLSVALACACVGQAEDLLKAAIQLLPSLPLKREEPSLPAYQGPASNEPLVVGIRAFLPAM